MSNEAHENQLPAAVQAQVAEADRIIEEVYKTDPDPDPTPDPDPEPDPAPDPEPDPAPDPEPDPEPDPAPAADDDLAHKHRVLQGKYNAEVPRLHKQLRQANDQNAELRQRITNLETLVASMKETAAKPDPAPAATPEALTDEEIRQFGPDLIDIIRRVAKAETGVVLDAQLKPVKETVERVSQSVASKDEDVANSARKRLLEDLAVAVPDWEQQNVDVKFLNWLDEVDPYAGLPRGTLLINAFEKNDTQRVIAIFKGFKQENAVVDPNQGGNETPDPAPDPDPEPEPEQPQNLDDLVAPGSPKTGTTGAQEEAGKGRIWTKADIEQFTLEKNEFVRKHPTRDLPENLQKLERDLFAAQSEGRIRI